MHSTRMSGPVVFNFRHNGSGGEAEGRTNELWHHPGFLQRATPVDTARQRAGATPLRTVRPAVGVQTPCGGRAVRHKSASGQVSIRRFGTPCGTPPGSLQRAAPVDTARQRAGTIPSRNLPPAVGVRTACGGRAVRHASVKPPVTRHRHGRRHLTPNGAGRVRFAVTVVCIACD